MLKRIFSYMNEYKKYAWLALICIAVEAVLELMVPMIMADLIDTGVSTGDDMYIYKKGLQMVICAILALILGIGSSRFSALAGQGLGANLRKELFIFQHRPFQGIITCNTSYKRCNQYTECRINRHETIWTKSYNAYICNLSCIFH